MSGLILVARRRTNMSDRQTFCDHCHEPIDQNRGYWRHTATRNPYCGGPLNAAHDALAAERDQP